MLTTIIKPWGKEEILALNGFYCMKELLVMSGNRLSLQYHEKKVETMYCVDGKGTLQVEVADELVNVHLFNGIYYHILPGQKHRLMADKGVNLRVVECSTPFLDDVVRFEDDFGRVK